MCRAFAQWAWQPQSLMNAFPKKMKKKVSCFMCTWASSGLGRALKGWAGRVRTAGESGNFIIALIEASTAFSLTLSLSLSLYNCMPSLFSGQANSQVFSTHSISSIYPENCATAENKYIENEASSWCLASSTGARTKCQIS